MTRLLLAGRQARAHPLPHLHQGGGGGDAGRGCSSSWATGRCCPTRSSRRTSAEIGARARRRRRPAQGAPPVRPGAGNAGRPEDPDHPRLLRERCSSRFPLEAGVSAGFNVLDDQTARELIADGARARAGARRQRRYASSPTPSRTSSRKTSEAALHAASRRRARRRPAQARALLRRHCAATTRADARDARAAHGATTGRRGRRASRLHSAPTCARSPQLPAIVAWLDSGSKTDQDRGASAGALRSQDADRTMFDACRDALLTGRASRCKKLATEELSRRTARSAATAGRPSVERFCAAEEQHRAAARRDAGRRGADARRRRARGLCAARSARAARSTTTI